MSDPTTCAVCRRRMIYVGFPEHPSCSSPDGHLYRVEFPSGKAAALQAVSAARPDLVAKGVAIIREAAENHPFVSANTVRDQMTSSGILGPRVGAVFNAAAKELIVKRDGFIPSSKGNTNSHHITRWCSLIYKGRAA